MNLGVYRTTTIYHRYFIGYHRETTIYQLIVHSFSSRRRQLIQTTYLNVSRDAKRCLIVHIVHFICAIRTLFVAFALFAAFVLFSLIAIPWDQGNKTINGQSEHVQAMGGHMWWP